MPLYLILSFAGMDGSVAMVAFAVWLSRPVEYMPGATDPYVLYQLRRDALIAEEKKRRDLLRRQLEAVAVGVSLATLDAYRRGNHHGAKSDV